VWQQKETAVKHHLAGKTSFKWAMWVAAEEVGVGFLCESVLLAG